jgi:acyl-CoA thioesterase FadM
VNLYLRLLRVIAVALAAPKIGPYDTSIVRMRTWPVDVELSRANNGRYVTIMDLGRMDYLCRTGCLREIVARRWRPLVAGLTIRYRRSLVVLQPFELHTRLLWWDARFVYFEQRFVQDGETAAVAIVRTAARDGRGLVPTEKLRRVMGFPANPPPCPEAIRLWTRADDAMTNATAELARAS